MPVGMRGISKFMENKMQIHDVKEISKEIFDETLEMVLIHEGGYIDDPHAKVVDKITGLAKGLSRCGHQKPYHCTLAKFIGLIIGIGAIVQTCLMVIAIQLFA